MYVPVIPPVVTQPSSSTPHCAVARPTPTQSASGPSDAGRAIPRPIKTKRAHAPQLTGIAPSTPTNQRLLSGYFLLQGTETGTGEVNLTQINLKRGR